MSQPSPATQAPRPTSAPHPFDLPSADLILRTADLVDFRVHAPILALASPFFATMLALPQPATDAAPSAPHAGEQRGAMPVVPVSEDSATLELLLRLVYPISKPRAKMEDLQMIMLALRAAAKYEMELPIDLLSERLVAAISKSPLQVWAAACRTGFEDVARQAAVALRTSWVRDGTKEVLSFMNDLGDMSGISAAEYLRLKQFLKAEQSVIEGGKLTLLSPPVASPHGPQLVSSELPLPFSTKLPSPDVICRSSSRMGSRTLFGAHQVVLCIYSPVLEARLAELRAGAITLSNDFHTPAPVVLDFDEKADVLSHLLKACYEGAEGLPTDLGLAPIAELLCACRKYEMKRIAYWVRAAWNREALRHPLEAYFVAISYGLNECARADAKNLLTEPIGDAYATIMESAPAQAYHRLLLYLDECRQVSRGRFAEVSSRMPEYVYWNFYGSSTADLKTALNDFASGAHGVSPEGTPKDALQKILIKSMSRCQALTESPFWSLLHPLIQSMTSVPDTVAAAIDDIQITLA